MPDGPDVELIAVQGLVRIDMGGVPCEEPDRVVRMEVESPCHSWVSGHCYRDCGVRVGLQKMVSSCEERYVVGVQGGGGGVGGVPHQYAGVGGQECMEVV